MLEITNENGLKLRPEFKEAWLAALRSGEYTQTRGYLHVIENVTGIEEGWCCLGVACDVLAKSGVDMLRSVVTIGDGSVEDFDGNGQMPGRDVRESMFVRPPFMSEETFADATNDIVSSLAYANDDHHSFEEIIEWVEGNL